jgi:hypothetical protein
MKVNENTKVNLKSEFESRIEFHSIKLFGKKAFEATVFWDGKLHETIKYTKELCTSDLKRKANIIEK